MTWMDRMLTLILGCSAPELLDREVLLEGCQDLAVGELPSDHPARASGFDRCAMAFEVPTFGFEGVSDEAVLHLALVNAEYLDNDEDGAVDDPTLLQELHANNAVNVALRTEADQGKAFSGDFASGVEAQPTWESEMDASVEPWFDASYEEVLHLINFAGHARAYPEVFGLERGSQLMEALDAADHYHYNDPTCRRDCDAIEYLYWATTTRMGLQEDPQRCEWISDEWEVCTAEDLEATDPLIMGILINDAYPYPSVAPDGVYAPQ